MGPTPADLVELFHMVRHNGDEPVSWSLPETLWNAVRRAAEENGVIVDDPTTVDRSLLGLPVEIAEPDALATLTIRTEGQAQVVPIVATIEDA